MNTAGGLSFHSIDTLLCAIPTVHFIPWTVGAVLGRSPAFEFAGHSPRIGGDMSAPPQKADVTGQTMIISDFDQVHQHSRLSTIRVLSLGMPAYGTNNL